jgi:hypothetical protein
MTLGAHRMPLRIRRPCAPGARRIGSTRRASRHQFPSPCLDSSTGPHPEPASSRRVPRRCIRLRLRAPPGSTALEGMRRGAEARSTPPARNAVSTTSARVFHMERRARSQLTWAPFIESSRHDLEPGQRVGGRFAHGLQVERRAEPFRLGALSSGLRTIRAQGWCGDAMAGGSLRVGAGPHIHQSRAFTPLVTEPRAAPPAWRFRLNHHGPAPFTRGRASVAT